MKKSCLVLLGCALAAVANADTIKCVNTAYAVAPNDCFGAGHKPSAENDYVVDADQVFTTGKNSVENFSFDGGSLTIGSSKESSGKGKLVFYGKGTVTVPCGIRICHASGHVNYGASKDKNTYTHHVVADITVDPVYKGAPQISTEFRSNGQHLYFDGALIGDEKTGMQFFGNEWSNDNTNDVVAFTGDMSKYYGYIDIYGSKLYTIPDSNPVAKCTNTLILALGNVECPGTVKLSDGPYAFLRTVDTDDIAKIGTLVMPKGATLYPEVDIAEGKCGCIEVTKSFEFKEPQEKRCILAKFMIPEGMKEFEAKRFPVLRVVNSAIELNAESFELVLQLPDAFRNVKASLTVEKGSDAQTLYLDVAAYKVKDVMLTISDKEQESAFLEGYASHWDPSGVPENGRTYHVEGGKELRTPYLQGVGTQNKEPFGDPVYFGGDEIVLGSATSAGKMSHWTWAQVNIPRLVISNGTYASGGNYGITWPGLRGGLLNSEVVICATDPSKAVFSTGNTWQHLYIDGSLKGDSSSAMRFLFTNANSDMHLYSDCSGYNGTIEVSATAGHGNNVADFRIGCKKIPGTLRLGTTTDVNGGKIKFAATNGLEVAKLIVNRPTQMSMGVNAVTFATDYAPITVTENIELNSSITLDVTVSGGDPITLTDNLHEAFIPILKYPASCNIDESNFNLGNLAVSGNSSPKTPNVGYFTMLCRTDGEWCVMGLYKRKMCYLAYPDDSLTNSIPHDTYTNYFYTARTSFDECYEQESDRAYGWNWNDGVRPHPDCDYYVYNTLRTNSKMNDVFFQGHSMLLCGGSIVMQSYTATVTNLIMNTGNLLHIHEGGDRILNAFAPGGTRTVFGNAYVAKGGATFTAPFIKKVGCFDVSLNISGIGDIKLLMNANDTYPLDVSFPCYLKLSKDNSCWTGKLMCAAANANQWSESECLTVLFSDKNNLGGELSAFTYNGITLRQSSILKPLNSVAYSRGNRGIFIEGVGGMYPTNNITFAVNAPVTYYGKLRKLGGGVLTFGGPAKFLQLDKTVGDMPVTDTDLNVLCVEEGSVGVTAPLACDGVKAVFEDGASLCVKVSGSDDDLASKGWTSVKTDTPFVLNASDGKLPVTFDASGLVSNGSKYETAICTVSASAAEKLRGKFRLKRPGLKGYVAELIDEVVDAGAQTVTFRARLRYSAMKVILR